MQILKYQQRHYPTNYTAPPLELPARKQDNLLIYLIFYLFQCMILIFWMKLKNDIF